MVSGFARCGVALTALVGLTTCYKEYRHEWRQDKEVPVHAVAGEARRNVVSVQLRQDGADLVATATTQQMCRRTQTGKFAMRYTKTAYRKDDWLAGPGAVGAFVGGPLVVLGLATEHDTAGYGFALVGAAIGLAVYDYLQPLEKTSERFEPTRDGEVRWDGDFRACAGSSPAPLANATIVFAASYQWGAQSQSFEVGTDGNGVAIARGLAAHTSGTATYCGDSSVSASVKGIAANDDPTLPNDSTIAAAAPSVGIAPTRTEFRWDLGRPGATASEEVGMNTTEVGVLRECAAQGACNRCFAACTNADKQNADRCNGIDDSDKRYWCLRNATHDLDACQAHCRPFCPGPVPDTLPTAAPTPAPAHTAPDVPPADVTVGGDVADWPGPGAGERMIRQEANSSGQPLEACASARNSAYINLVPQCGANENLARYLIFAPACRCKRVEKMNLYNCTVQTEALCRKNPSPRTLFGASSPEADEATAKQSAIVDARAKPCIGIPTKEEILGCHSDPTTHRVTCFASAECPMH